MKAISVKQPWASLIAAGIKLREIRTFGTPHRGPLLIVASATADADECSYLEADPSKLPRGEAVCVVDLVDVEPFDLDDPDEKKRGWVLANPRPVEPFPVKGQQGFYDVPDRDVHMLLEERALREELAEAEIAGDSMRRERDGARRRVVELEKEIAKAEADLSVERERNAGGSRQLAAVRAEVDNLRRAAGQPTRPHAPGELAAIIERPAYTAGALPPPDAAPSRKRQAPADKIDL